MAHTIIDEAHIADQQNRISALALRLHEQWVKPERNVIGDDVGRVLRPSASSLREDQSSVGKNIWDMGDDVSDEQIMKIDFTKASNYRKRLIKFKLNMRPAWMDGASRTLSTPPVSDNINRRTTLLPPLNVSHLKNSPSTVPSRVPTVSLPTDDESSVGANHMPTFVIPVDSTKNVGTRVNAVEDHAVKDKFDQVIDKAVLLDRIRRSHRNARFHRARGVTPGKRPFRCCYPLLCFHSAVQPSAHRECKRPSIPISQLNTLHRYRSFWRRAGHGRTERRHRLQARGSLTQFYAAVPLSFSLFELYLPLPFTQH
jgi:hypothetical protein